MRGLISRVAMFIARVLIRSSEKTSDPMSGYFGFRKSLTVPVDERWRGYKTLLFILAANPNAKVADVPYTFRERDRGKSKIVSGFHFIRTYITEILLVARVEHRYRT